jgi:hypothetical protein
VSGSPYGALGTIARYGYLTKEFQFQVCVHVHVVVLVLVHVFVRICVCVNIKYGSVNIYVRHGSCVVSSQGSYEVVRKLKGPHS